MWGVGDARSQPLLVLDLPGCLPAGLTSLSLSRVALSPSALAGLPSHLAALESLSLSEFELGCVGEEESGSPLWCMGGGRV